MYLTWKTKIWSQNHLSRRFGKYSFQNKQTPNQMNRTLVTFLENLEFTYFQMKKFLVFFCGNPFHRCRNWIQEFSNLRKQIVSDQLLIHRSIGHSHDENCKFWLRKLEKSRPLSFRFCHWLDSWPNVNKCRKRLREWHNLMFRLDGK